MRTRSLNGARGESYRRDLDLVFCKWDGSPYDPDETTRRFEARDTSCPGVLRIRFHDLRHTHATLLLESGESVKYVPRRLGDREDTAVETYAHVTPRTRSSAVSKVRGFFSGGAMASEVGVATPRVEVDCDPPVPPAGRRRHLTPMVGSESSSNEWSGARDSTSGAHGPEPAC